VTRGVSERVQARGEGRRERARGESKRGERRERWGCPGRGVKEYTGRVFVGSPFGIN
jgi:hypothetical protein